jgi:Cu/Ag efflux protein CusF
MKNIKYLLVAALTLSMTAAVAGSHEAELDRPSFAAQQTMVVTAVVEAIDHETRVVTVRRDDGEELTFTASEEARNLDQVSVGDVLVAEFVETITVEVLPGDGLGPDGAEAAAMARTKEGEMPGIAAMDSTVVISTVEDINIEANTFKLKGPDGVVTEYVARNPENLKRSKVGDIVVITDTVAMAITVEKAPTEE